MSTFDELIGKAAKVGLNVIESYEKAQEKKSIAAAKREEILTSIRLTKNKIKEPGKEYQIVIRDSYQDSLAFKLQAITHYTKGFWQGFKKVMRLLNKWTMPPPTSSCYESFDEVVKKIPSKIVNQDDSVNQATGIVKSVEEKVAFAKFKRSLLDTENTVQDIEIAEKTIEDIKESIPDNKDEEMEFPNKVIKQILTEAPSKKRRKKKKPKSGNNQLDKKTLNNQDNAEHAVEHTALNDIKEDDMKKVLQTNDKDKSGLGFTQNTVPQNLPAGQKIEAEVISTAEPKVPKRKVLPTTPQLEVSIEQKEIKVEVKKTIEPLKDSPLKKSLNVETIKKVQEESKESVSEVIQSTIGPSLSELMNEANSISESSILSEDLNLEDLENSTNITEVVSEVESNSILDKVEKLESSEEYDNLVESKSEVVINDPVIVESDYKLEETPSVINSDKTAIVEENNTLIDEKVIVTLDNQKETSQDKPLQKPVDAAQKEEQATPIFAKKKSFILK